MDIRATISDVNLTEKRYKKSGERYDVQNCTWRVYDENGALASMWNGEINAPKQGGQFVAYPAGEYVLAAASVRSSYGKPEIDGFKMALKPAKALASVKSA